MEYLLTLHHYLLYLSDNLGNAFLLIFGLGIPIQFVIMLIRGDISLKRKVSKIKKLSHKDNEKFIEDIRQVLNKITLQAPMHVDTPIYYEALNILKNNPAISEYQLSVFQDDEALRALANEDDDNNPFNYSPHGCQLRIILLIQMINSFYYEETENKK